VAGLPRRADGSFAGGPVACAISLGDHDEAAIRFAGAFATSADRRLVLARVVGPQDAARHAATRAFQHIEDARGRLAAGVAGDIALRAGTLADRLVDAARDARADALVVAARTQEHPVDPLLGSLAHSLWTSAPCPVVFVEGAAP
jgi:nucleotide-binding universal stress UspA family protein